MCSPGLDVESTLSILRYAPRDTSLLIDLFPQGGIKLNRCIKIKDERLKRTCMPHYFKTVLKVRRGNTLAGIYEMVYPIILPSIRYSFLVY